MTVSFWHRPPTFFAVFAIGFALVAYVAELTLEAQSHHESAASSLGGYEPLTVSLLPAVRGDLSLEHEGR